jgi:exodeoxyribonuclease VII small subunit
MKNSEGYLDFEQTLNRLHEIVSLVRKKELGLEESIDLLEEGVHLANVCTENIDKAQWLNSTEGDKLDEGKIS